MSWLLSSTGVEGPGKGDSTVTIRVMIRRAAGTGFAVAAMLGLAACGGDADSTPTETVTVTSEPGNVASATAEESKPASPKSESTGAAPAEEDPFGGMAAVTGSLSTAETCDYIRGFQTNLPGNVAEDPAGARDAVAQLRLAAPQELSGNLRGMEQVLSNYADGNNPMQAVEGKMTGLMNQCRGLANR